MEKLGLEDLPGAGVEVLIYAKATVTSSSINETPEGKRSSMSLQITDLCVEPGAAKKKATSEVMFAKG